MLNDQQLQILTGLMLGDGFLEKHKNGKRASLRIARKRLDKNYLLYHANIFANINVKISDYKFYDKRTDKIYYGSRMRTKVSDELTEIWRIWYKKDKKIIPKDIKLTPIILATWFADDGSISIKGGHYRLKLSTHGFLKKEVIFLKKLIKTTFNINMKIYEDNSGDTKHWFLDISNKENIRKFIEIIEPVFPEGMERKSNIWKQNEKLLAKKEYPACIYCNSNQIYKNGSYKNGEQKYLCKKCRRQFKINRIRKIYQKINKNCAKKN